MLDKAPKLNKKQLKMTSLQLIKRVDFSLEKKFIHPADSKVYQRLVSCAAQVCILYASHSTLKSASTISFLLCMTSISVYLLLRYAWFKRQSKQMFGVRIFLHTFLFM